MDAGMLILAVVSGIAALELALVVLGFISDSPTYLYLATVCAALAVVALLVSRLIAQRSERRLAQSADNGRDGAKRDGPGP